MTTRRGFLKLGAAGAAGLGLGLARPARAVVEPDPCVPGLSYIHGDVAGTVPAGETWHVVGDVNLTGDLVVEGTLTGIDAFTLEGNGHQMLVQHGGRLDLAGVPKVSWAEWGDPVSGWNVGDRLLVAPTAEGALDPAETIWQGSWAATARPGISPDVTLRDGRVMRPEVANLTQSVTLRHLARIMFHMGPGVQALRNVAVVDSGVSGTLGFYPLHFHLASDASRGSTLTDVVVEGGLHHAFVPHGSHGITFTRCVAAMTRRDAFWWDPLGSQGSVGGGLDASHDLVYDRCAAIGVHTEGTNFGSGFRLANGRGNRMVNCRAAGVRGGRETTGVHWRHDTHPWEFSGFVGHNNYYGQSVWQNTGAVHSVVGSTCYRNRGADFDHGAYGNLYHFRDLYGERFVLHAKSEEGDGYLTIENSDLAELVVTKHALGRWKEAKVIGSQIGVVRYNETEGKPSWMQYIDCGLTPADFIIDQIRAETVIEIFEAGVLTARWADGGWS